MKMQLIRAYRNISSMFQARNVQKHVDHIQEETDIELVREFIDTEWYRNTYNDVNFDSIEPAAHYLSVGAQERRAPHPLFDTDWYVQKTPELHNSEQNPLLHFLKNKDRSVSAHPLFDGCWYLEQYSDVRASGTNALRHYIKYGASEKRNPHPLFDARLYYENNSEYHYDNPLIHYLAGYGKGPHVLFDEQYYRQQIPQIDIDESPLLLHFVLRGAAAGYNPNRFFDCHWYINNHENLQDTGENPLVHFLRAGLEEGRDPHPRFDLDWYLFTYPDVARSGMNPLEHYLSSGERQGRHTHPADAADENVAVLDIPYEIRRDAIAIKGRDTCIFVTYSRSGVISPHTQLYVDALRENGIAIILTIVTDGLDQPLPSFTESVEGLVVRINHGWDFAAWAAVLAAIPEVWSARSLILTNDSIFGPTSATAFSKMIERIRASDADFIALTDSYQVRPHLMSYFSVLKTNALKSERVRRFWNEIRSLRDKWPAPIRWARFEVSASSVA